MQEQFNELNTSNEPVASDEEASVVAAQSRRDALRKIGRYSTYAAPVMMAMLSKQALAS